ncbi:MAG: ComF family protein [Egibacteraceae bacterium]
MSVMRAVWDLAAPPRCAACDRPAAVVLCLDCADAAERLVLADRGFLQLGEQIAAIGGFAYDGVIRDVVHRVKLSHRHAAAAGLSRMLFQLLDPPGWPVTWVPSRRRSRKERGAEIPRLLAGVGAGRLLAVGEDRPDQTTLDARARRLAPAGSFRAVAAVPERVVLVDDIRTTGATLTAAASCLQSAGARRVLAVTLAVADGAARPSA